LELIFKPLQEACQNLSGWMLLKIPTVLIGWSWSRKFKKQFPASLGETKYYLKRLCLVGDDNEGKLPKFRHTALRPDLHLS
jgi:hypothetical protein